MPYARCSKCKVNDTGAKTTNLKNKNPKLTTNISYRLFSSKSQFFIIRKTRALN